MSTPTPPVIPQPFAASAGPSFINTIPDVSADPQLADYQSGFKPLTFQPVGSGGVPPLGQDFNGILNAITAHLYALQGGSLQAFSADVAAAIGGYNKGAIVAMSNSAGYWLCLASNTTTDPDDGGPEWQPVYMYGAGPAIDVTGGVRTLDALESARPFLLLTGTLSGNQQIVVPNVYRSWLVINRCVLGAFTLTVKTATGTGVVVPSGDSASPTAIYCDAENAVNRVFTPAALPTSVVAVPDSILLRDNLGVGYGLTRPIGDATLALATTEFVNRPSSLSTNGYEIHANGLIEQWGFHSFSNAVSTVTFPLAFPNACYNVQLTPRALGASLRDKAPTLGVLSLANFTMQDSDGSQGTYWVAKGR